jgi:DNA-binding response OmpR family regulator
MKTLPKILIIDDESIIRQTLDVLLSSENVELLFAENGKTGIKVAAESIPDAILLDVMMPEMDGYEVCRRIRANPALAEIPIIMITALDDRDSRLAGLRAGADDFLTKPFDGVEIQIRIKNILRINRYRNLLAERTRFLWIVENDSQGYMLLAQNGNIVYANPRAQIYFHLPEIYTGINFTRQTERYYQTHILEDAAHRNVRYLVQPESATARAFWLRVEVLNTTLGVENEHLVRVSDVTDEMTTHHDTRKIHSLVSHKLRTPVSHLYTNMTILDTQIEFIPDEEIKPMIKTAWKGSERLVTEILDILNYMDAPMALANGTPVCLGEMGEMILAAGETLNIKKISIAMPAPLAECKLRISTSAMDLILHEILENSKKFHPTQMPQVQICIEAHGEDKIQLQFLDDGQTMTAEQMIRARQPYSQSEKWFTGEIPGMGLGIPLITTLVWQAGGQVRIDNRDDQVGLCVSLTLPILK